MAAVEEAIQQQRARELQAKRRLAQTQRELLVACGRGAVSRVAVRNRETAEEMRAATQNTALRSALAGRAPASEEELLRHSLTFNTRMRELFAEPSFIKLFRLVDTDCSGRITFDELVALSREELSLLPASLTDDDINSIWIALDTDGSGFIGAGEVRTNGALTPHPEPTALARACVCAAGEARGSHLHLSLSLARARTPHIRCSRAFARPRRSRRARSGPRLCAGASTRCVSPRRGGSASRSATSARRPSSASAASACSQRAPSSRGTRSASAR